MRSRFSVVFTGLLIATAICAIIARRSKKPIGRSVSLLLISLMPPVLGNLLIVMSGDRLISYIGSYIYFIGMDFVVLELLHFTFAYCDMKWPNKISKVIFYLMISGDAVQLLLNPVFGHAFRLRGIVVDKAIYYQLVPAFGQSVHRVVDYSVFLVVLILFFYKTIRSLRIYSERYSVILTSMIVAGLWQTFYIFSRTPIDRSMIGFAVFGLLVFYFSLYYRPMRLLDRMLANVVSGMPEALFFFDIKNVCIWANGPGVLLAGIEGNDFEKAHANLESTFGKLDLTERSWSARRIIGTGSDMRYYQIEKLPVQSDNQRDAGALLSIRDNTEAQLALQQEIYNATHDSLTKLYTKEFLYERIHEVVSSNPGVQYMIGFIDVNDFKMVNDVFGTDFGDYSLICISDWIRTRFAEHGIYGRLAGDTFGVFLPVSDFDRDQIENDLAGFFVKNGIKEHHIFIHFGVYEITETDLDVSVMFDRAHLALASIKGDLQKCIAYYDDRMRERILWEQHISSQLPEALSTRQIRPYLQPIVDASGEVVGAEALVRWIHPVDGFLSPADFVPIFEKNGMIAEVDKYMWTCACEILARWEADNRDTFISVNISPIDFYFMDVKEVIRGIVDEFGINPVHLRLEITETVMMNDIENRIHILNSLKEAGFIVEMDDFGSGYSSLNMLKDMPVDVLKLDMVFLNNSKNNPRSDTIVKNILHLSEDLGIPSLTEGVETEGQYHMLSSLGCKLFQGYYFSKPVPVEEFEKKYFAKH